MFGDRKGPMGNGEKTGRGLGYCSGYDAPGYMAGRGGFRRAGSGYGRAFGCRRGLGMGRKFGAGMGFGEIMSLDRDYPSNEEYLKRTKEVLEKELEEVKAKIQGLEK
jgi:hypothetical protein